MTVAAPEMPPPPAASVGALKSLKYALVKLAGGPLEQVLFLWRLAKLRTKSLLGQPYAAFYSMDRRLEKHLGFRGGTFIEAGANDGIAQSNTYFLEKKWGWSGLLVEPVPKYSRMCSRARSAKVVNCALGPLDKDGGELEILSGGLMSLPVAVDESQLRGRSVAEHAAFGAREFGARAPELIRVPVRALSLLLDEAGITKVDFMSLDVEGFELEVLKGLDISRHAPDWLLIETAQLDAVTAFLGKGYELVEPYSHHDFLFKRVPV
jgi:FkbM family methyltransferase